MTSRDVDNAEWWLNLAQPAERQDDREIADAIWRCGGDGRNNMLGPIQSDAYRWDGICNYLRAGFYEVCTTLQLI